MRLSNNFTEHKLTKNAKTSDTTQTENERGLALHPLKEIPTEF